MHPQLHHVSTNRASCPPSYLLLLAGTSGKFPGTRWLHMPKLGSALQSKITCQGGTSHAFQWESIAELRKEVEFYLSFMDEEVFWGIDLPKEEGSNPSAPATSTANAPGTTNTPEVPPIPKVAPKYARWGHSSTPILTCGSHGGTPQPTTAPRLKRRALQLT